MPILASPARIATVDVVVVGAGPSGLSTAASLGRHGIRTLVVDKHPNVSIFPKATGLRTRGLEILRGWGLEPALRAVEQPLLPRVVSQNRLVDPADAARNWLPDDRVVRRASPTTYSSVSQDQLEPVLLDYVRSLGVEIEFGSEVVGVHQRDEDIIAELRPRNEGPRRRIRARFLVAADGANSFVRTAAGIGVEQLGTRGPQAAALFFAELGTHLREPLSLGHALQASAAEGLLFPSGADRWLYNVAASAVPGEAPAQWSAARWTERIRRAVGVEDLAVRIERVFPWEYGAAAATALRSGRVLLVGDAAHRTTPSGGTGISVGIADAHNLAWKLAWIVRGWAHNSLLDSYPAERGPVARQAAMRSMSAEEEDPLRRLSDDLAVEYRSGAVIPDRTTSWEAADLGRIDGRPGMRVPHAWVSGPTGPLSTLDLVEGQLTLLTGAVAQEWERAGDWVAATGTPLRVLRLGELRSTEPLSERFGVTELGAVLVRPDGYVAWRAAAARPEPTRELDRAVGAVLGRRLRTRSALAEGEELATAC